MGSYSTVYGSFWTDPDVVDNFTPEDRYFYLYLLTSVHSNISGCYQLSIKQAADEMGYSRDTVSHLIERFVNVHKMIDYDYDTKEVLICKWGKHHWTTSDKYLIALRNKIDEVKSSKFKAYLQAIYERFEDRSIPRDTVFIPYQYGIDTTVTYTYTYTDTYTDTYTGDREIGGPGGREKEDATIEAEAVSPEDVPVITFTLNDGTEYPISQSFYLQMQELYPAVDVMQELRNMKAWCLTNPAKRKTKKGAAAFVNNWLSKEQNRGGGYSRNVASGNGVKRRGFRGKLEEMEQNGYS